MEIIEKDNNRILIKENNIEVNINDGTILQYTGIYYKNINDNVEYEEIETTFIGIIITERFRHDVGIYGIYIEPLYIFNKIDDEWNKIIKYKSPDTKHFYYPHLLILQNTYCSYKPLYFLHTVENISLNNFTNVTKSFSLDI